MSEIQDYVDEWLARNENLSTTWLDDDGVEMWPGDDVLVPEHKDALAADEVAVT